MTFDGPVFGLFLLFLWPVMPPVGLLLTSVPAAVWAARGSARYLSVAAVDVPASQAWFLFAAANLALHAFFAVALGYVAVVDDAVVLLLLGLWVVVQDTVMVVAMARARRHRAAYLAPVGARMTQS